MPNPKKEQLDDYFLEKGDHELDNEYKNPTANEWLDFLAIDIKKELPKKTIKKDINVSLFINELNSKLNNLRLKQRTHIEETGSNILYLVIGLLKWKDKNRDFFSPLYIIPIDIIKDFTPSGQEKYTIKLSNDNIINNITLKEKLRNDFSINLPIIEDNEEIETPESYLGRVSNTINQIDTSWKILREAYITNINFQKQVMYNDLKFSS